MLFRSYLKTLYSAPRILACFIILANVAILWALFLHFENKSISLSSTTPLSPKSDKLQPPISKANMGNSYTIELEITNQLVQIESRLDRLSNTFDDIILSHSSPAPAVQQLIVSPNVVATKELKQWLIIGIPTIGRPNGVDYLSKTLAHIVSQLPTDPVDPLFGQV